MWASTSSSRGVRTASWTRLMNFASMSSSGDLLSRSHLSFDGVICSAVISRIQLDPSSSGTSIGLIVEHRRAPSSISMINNGFLVRSRVS